MKPILLVQANHVDAIAVQRAWEELKIANQLEIASNGEEALKRLGDSALEKPGVILLDLNMPQMNGLEFLEIVKDDPRLKRIPVIILATSKEELAIAGGFSRGAAGYIVKPADDTEFLEVLRTIDLYWTLNEISSV